MLLPFAIAFIILFIVLALSLIIRKANGRKELRNNQEVSGNEKKIIKGK